MPSTRPEISPDAVLNALNWRYATKKFDRNAKIAPDLWQKLESVLVLSPSSFGLQPWRFVVVQDAAVRELLRPVSWNQPQIVDASHLVVLCRALDVSPADIDAYVASISAQRGVPVEALAGYRGMMVGALSNPAGLSGGSMDSWTRCQVYIALGGFMTAAAVMGIDACPIEGFEPTAYDRILKLKEKGLGSTVVVAAGYRSSEDASANARKVRFPVGDMVIRV